MARRLFVVAMVGAISGVGVACLVPCDSFAQPRMLDRACDPAPSPLTQLPDRAGVALPDRATARLGAWCLRDNGEIYSIVFLPDGATLASSGSGSGLVLWDSVTGLARSISAKAGGGRVTAVSKNGTELAVAGRVGSADQLWSIRPGKKPELMDEVLGNTTLLAFALSPDGKWLAEGEEARLAVWDVEKRKVRFELGNRLVPTTSVYDVLTFSPDGKYLAFAGGLYPPAESKEREIQLWEVDTGAVVRKLQKHRQKVTAMAFSPDSKMLAAATRDEAVWLWDLGEDKVVHELPLKDCCQLAFSPDGKLLATADMQTGVIRLWNPNTGEELSSIKNGGFWIRSMTFSPDGKTLAAANGCRGIRLWDVATCDEVPPFAGHSDPVLSVVFSADGKTLASYSSDATVRTWDVASRKARRTLSYGEPSGLKNRVCLISFSSDACNVVVAGGCQTAQECVFMAWNTASGVLEAAVRPETRTSWTSSVSLASDDDTLATADIYGVHLWSLKSRKIVKQLIQRPNLALDGLNDEDLCAIFSPDGQTLAAFETADRTVRLWDWQSGTLLRQIPLAEKEYHVSTTDQRAADASFRRIPPADRECYCLAFSPDGHLVAACNPGPVRVWETVTGKLLRKFGEDREGTRSVAFAPDGRRLIVATKASVDVWDVLTGEELSAPTGKPLLGGGHKGDVLCAAISPDGKTIASGGADTTILLWDAHDLLPKTPATHPTAKDLDGLWDDLKSDDTPTAYNAVLPLLGAPDEAAALRKERVAPASKPDADKVKVLLAQLDANDFDSREAASRELFQLGEAVEPNLRAALDGDPSAEAKGRCERLLDAIQKGTLDADGLRRLRAVGVLERLGSGDARGVLKALADGAPGRISREAKLALDRLDKRAP